MAKQKHPYAPYKTARLEPKYVKYWEKHFVKCSFWLDWIVFKITVYDHISEVKEYLLEENKISTTKEAKSIIWNAVIAAYEGEDDRNPIMKSYRKFIDVIDDSEMMLFLAHLQIGNSIHQGLSEAKARKEYLEWLQEDPENPVWGEYALTNDFQIISLDEYRESLTKRKAASRKKKSPK